LSELRDSIALKIDELRRREDKLIEALAKQHQIVDAENLLEALVKRAALKSILDDLMIRI